MASFASESSADLCVLGSGIVTSGASALLIVCSLLALAGLWLLDPGLGN